jgi:hypothetical protein
VTLCVVYIVHKETRSTCFLVEPQNQVRRFVSGLTSKSLGWFVSGPRTDFGTHSATGLIRCLLCLAPRFCFPAQKI